MPRTTTVESPGCPPLRALTFDVLGLIKVVEARGKQGGGGPSVVERWGEPDSSRCVLAASMIGGETDSLLAVARKNGLIEVLNPLSGDLCVSIANGSEGDHQSEDDSVVGLHIARGNDLGLSSRSCILLTCTTKGHAKLRSFEVPNSLQDSASSIPSKEWDVCAYGSILCSRVDRNEKHALYGGKGVEINVWDLDSCTKIWNAKSPAKNSLGIFTPTWFTSATFLSEDDHRKIVAGTNGHQVRLYDISAQRRPVISFDFRETPIKAVTEDRDGNTVYVGNGSGDLASFDIRTGKLLGCFLGKCAGSIKSIVRHPDLPVLASCGLDSYLRFWDVNSRQLLSAVFLKQPLSNVIFDSNFKDKAEAADHAEDLPLLEAHNVNDSDDDEVEEYLRVKRKKSPKERNLNGELKSKKRSKKLENSTPYDELEESPRVKQGKASKEHNSCRELKSKKMSKKLENSTPDDELEESPRVKRKKASEEHSSSRELKFKKRSKKRETQDDNVEETLLVERKKSSKEHNTNRKQKSKKKSKKVESEDGDV